jgi:hypothetical protein
MILGIVILLYYVIKSMQFMITKNQADCTTMALNAYIRALFVVHFLLLESISA